jgi:hypothetical protein
MVVGTNVWVLIAEAVAAQMSNTMIESTATNNGDLSPIIDLSFLAHPWPRR